MTLNELIALATKARQNGDIASFPPEEISVELQPLANLISELIIENKVLHENHDIAVTYIREKINQLLVVIGTIPLRTEELDEKNLIALDPIGIVSQSFSQILEHLRQTNKNLTLAKDEIQAIFESIGEGLLVLDQEMRILSYNRNFKKMFSIENEEIKGKRCKEIICCEKEPPDNCAFKKMMGTNKTASVFDWEYGKKHLRVVAAPIRDSEGTIIRSVMLYIDITEIIQARAALSEEKERLSITLESIADGVIATDTHGNISLMNRMAEKLTGWYAKEAIGKQVCDVLMIEDDKASDSCAQFFQNIIVHQLPAERIDNTMLISLDGVEYAIHLSAAPIHQPGQGVVGTIIVFRDITNEKRLEEEIAKSERIDSIGVFAGGIAHDFNNLLTSVLGNVSLAKELSNADDPIYSLLAETEKSSYRAKGLTQQLLTFAKGGAPIVALTSPQGLIKESAEFPLHGANIKCEFDIPENLWTVEIDEGQISQVIQNIIINASHAMPKGGTIQVIAKNRHIETPNNPLISAGDYIEIVIIDQGKGIPKEYLEKIFDPFFTTKESGSGLGLSICYSIVKKHHGLLTVDSNPESGTAFHIFLPATKKEVHPKEEIIIKDKKQTGKILVMDDEELIRKVTFSMLSSKGYQVETAQDGTEAVEMFKNALEIGAPYDLVLMDLTIPGGMGGKEAIIKLLEIDPTVKAVVSSGYANDPIMANYKQYGFCGVIPKPYRLNELIGTIADILTNDQHHS